jgi:cytochrome c peroxidase
MLRKRGYTLLVLLVFVATVVLSAKEGRQDLPGPSGLQLPKGWPKPKNIFKKNPWTPAGYFLGKRLFFDNHLSLDSSISCAGCHQPFAAFANYDHDLSHGVGNSLTNRNAPGLFNLAWSHELHWDGAINHLEVQPLSPLTAKNEMGETLEHVLYKLRRDSIYPALFKAAFGDTVVNSQRMLKAIAQFTGTLVSANSKYDRVMNGKDSFQPYEAAGYQVFKRNCAACHKEPLFTDHSFRNNGLALNRFKDIGRMKVTSQPDDSLKFKVPSLRNVQFTFPYFHDGSAYSLYQVVDHYLKGIQKDQKTLDPILKNGISMTEREKNELVLFLYTLSDSSFIRNPEYNVPLPVLAPH